MVVPRTFHNQAFSAALVFGILLLSSTTLINASHIDDTNGELSNFSFDRVVFRVQKDCSLDKIPDVSLQIGLI